MAIQMTIQWPSNCHLNLPDIQPSQNKPFPILRPLVNRRSCWAHRLPAVFHQFSVLATFVVLGLEIWSASKDEFYMKQIGIEWDMNGNISWDIESTTVF